MQNDPQNGGSPAIRWIDIGLNLFSKSFREPEKVLDDAESAGVYCILTGSDAQENRQIDKFIRTHSAHGTVGIHPHNADRAIESDFEEIRRIAQENPKIAAIGECGLDFDRMFSSETNQRCCLERQLGIAEELQKPLFLHERAAEDAFLKVFSSHATLCHRAVVHCFTGGRDFLERCLEMGFMIGITGWICDERRGKALRDAVRFLPLERVLLETDAPYLTPKGVPGLARTNVPQNIRYVCSTLADAMNVDMKTLEEHARKNTMRFFGLDHLPGDTQ